jgi:hypothetical protein
MYKTRSKSSHRLGRDGNRVYAIYYNTVHVRRAREDRALHAYIIRLR